MSRSFLVTLLLVTPTFADNWPQWRGPANDGVSRETNLPLHWSDTEGIAWKLKMPGMAGSTPCVWGDRIFLTSEDGKDLVLLCVSTGGKEMWQRKLGTGTGARYRTTEGNSASASPSTDGQRVYAFVGTGDFAAFDLDGKELWHFNAQDRYGKFRIQFGVHTTPALDNGRLYLQLIHDGGGYVIALDAATGKDVWKIERQSDGYAENKHSYASPCVWRKGTDACLIVHGNDYTTGHRLDNGEEIWRVAGLNPRERYEPTLRFVASPVATPDLIVIPSAKRNQTFALDPSAKGTVSPGNSLLRWTWKATPDVPSPLIYEGCVYLNGIQRADGSLTCLDAKDGQPGYVDKPLVPGERHRASPVGAGGHVYTTARNGTVCVVKAGKTFELVAKNKLPDTMTASPVVSGGRIYLRGFEYLWAVGK